MRFNLKHLLRLLPVVLLAGSAAAAGPRERISAEITVLVIDAAGVSPGVLSQMERETDRIFGEAGIEIAWVSCGVAVGDDPCRQVPGPNEFVLHIVPTGKTSSDLVFGVSFPGEDGKGKYCNVFFDRIRDAHRGVGTSTAQLLGTVAAHELGHLLLGFHSHSRWGIMEPVWREETLRQTGMGRLLFTTEQAGLMRARIEKERTVLVGWGRREQP
jgi:hypothetical protein